MTSGLNDYADKWSQLCFCVDITMAPFLSAHTGRDFMKQNKESASQRHSQENSLHESIIKSLPFSIPIWKPHFLPLLLWPALSISYCYRLITGNSSDPQNEQDNSFVIFYCSQSHRSSLSQSYAGYCAGLEEEPSYLVTCLSPEFHSVLLKEKSSVSFWKYS